MTTISVTEARAIMADTNAMPGARVEWIDGSDWSDEIDHRAAWAWVDAPNEVDLLGGHVVITVGGREYRVVS